MFQVDPEMLSFVSSSFFFPPNSFWNIPSQSYPAGSDPYHELMVSAAIPS